ncbi:MAG: EscJ/YscJ/HrcJ family type III secretion inner membrane ring protein [Rhabdochlamydiaceae bacterium]|nr:EscJ/YscJ/HrcJ family type III secretion inner membrane ring protein [Candidatus Amphrikana amoebophyrae]
MRFRHSLIALVLCSIIFVLTGCAKSQTVVSGVEERDANMIIVFLDSKGIAAIKMKQASSAIGGSAGATKFDIMVDSSRVIDAMAILNANGLPRRQGTTLLELFAKQGLMTTDKEETIRYRAGLESQIANMIMLIDGVIDTDIQLSFPETDSTSVEAQKGVVTAAVYVKHQGIIDDPNSHLDIKIKRLVSGSVNGLDINDVTVVTDRSRFTDISVADLSKVTDSQDYVSIWSIVMSRESAAKFRMIFFLIVVLATLFAAVLGWMAWKFYPTLKKQGGIKNLFNIKPFAPEKATAQKDEGAQASDEDQPPFE